jgi:hypothetical protein
MRLADGEGFEPSRRLHACRFSRPVPSTTRPPILQKQLSKLASARAPSQCQPSPAQAVAIRQLTRGKDNRAKPVATLHHSTWARQRLPRGGGWHEAHFTYCGHGRHRGSFGDSGFRRSSHRRRFPGNEMHLQGVRYKQRRRYGSVQRRVQRKDRLFKGLGALRLLQGGRTRASAIRQARHSTRLGA